MQLAVCPSLAPPRLASPPVLTPGCAVRPCHACALLPPARSTALSCIAGTPADKLLQMLTDLLDGTLPNLQDIMLIQSSILEARDIYQPWRLGKQLLETKDLEVGGCCSSVLGLA